MIRRPPRSTLFPYTTPSDLFVTHDREEVFALGERVLALENGRIIAQGDRKSTRLNSSHTVISYAVFCLKKKKIRYCLDTCHLLGAVVDVATQEGLNKTVAAA